MLDFFLMVAVSGTKRFEQALIYVRIPVKYWELQDRINVEAAYYRRHKEKGPPILSWDEIIKYVIMYIRCMCVRHNISRLGNQCNFTEENELAVAIKYVQGQG